jgi:hypothetical protein
MLKNLKMSNKKNCKETGKNEIDVDNPDSFAKLAEMYKTCNTSLIEQMNKNFEKHCEILRAEIFDLRNKFDQVEKENLKLKKENIALKNEQTSQKTMLVDLNLRVDNIEQEQLKNDVVLVGKFDLGTAPLSPTSISAFVKNTCSAHIEAKAITNFYVTKNIKGESVLKMSISNKIDRLALFKSRKNLAAKHIFVNEVLTSAKYKLLMCAKGLCKDKKLFSAWSREGKIFVRSSDISKPVIVTNIDHLSSLAQSLC